MKVGRLWLLRKGNGSKGFGMGILNCIDNKQSMPSTLIEGKRKGRGAASARSERVIVTKQGSGSPWSFWVWPL